MKNRSSTLEEKSNINLEYFKSLDAHSEWPSRLCIDTYDVIPISCKSYDILPLGDIIHRNSISLNGIMEWSD